MRLNSDLGTYVVTGAVIGGAAGVVTGYILAAGTQPDAFTEKKANDSPAQVVMDNASGEIDSALQIFGIGGCALGAGLGAHIYSQNNRRGRY